MGQGAFSHAVIRSWSPLALIAEPERDILDSAGPKQTTCQIKLVVSARPRHKQIEILVCDPYQLDLAVNQGHNDQEIQQTLAVTSLRF